MNMENKNIWHNAANSLLFANALPFARPNGGVNFAL